MPMQRARRRCSRPRLKSDRLENRTARGSLPFHYHAWRTVRLPLALCQRSARSGESSPRSVFIDGDHAWMPYLFLRRNRVELLEDISRDADSAQVTFAMVFAF